MKAKTEIFLCQCLWIADLMLRPTWRNVTGSFEGWAYSAGLLRQIQDLEVQGWLESRAEADGTQRLVRLTEKGILHAIGGCLPEERWNRAWDGKWRMVVFDVPENRRALRNELRKQLRAAGFGGLQGSVWISPDPMSSIAADLEKTAAKCGVMTMFEGVTCGGESNADLVGSAWDFETLEQSYGAYMEHLDKLPAASQKGLRGKLHAWWQKEHALWMTCIKADPLLPDVLLPKGYSGKKAWQAKRKAMRLAGQLATREASPDY